MENNEKLKIESKENSNLKVWEAPELIVITNDFTQAGPMTGSGEGGHFSITFSFHS